MTAAGQKFGKSEGGTTVWLDPALTSPYQLYQFWLNSTDADVEKYLKFFTWLSLDEITDVIAEHDKDRGKRLAQRELASRATAWVHGDVAARDAARASEEIFGGLANVGTLSGTVLHLVLSEVPSSTIARADVDAGPAILEILVRVGLADSKGAARRLLQQGGVSVNGAKVADEKQTLGGAHVLANGLIVLRAGKKNFHLLRVQ